MKEHAATAPSSPSPLSRLGRWLRLPWRLFQERTSVQLITSYVAVVLVVILLFEITIIVSLLWSPAGQLIGTEQAAVDPYLGERASAYVQWVEPDRIENVVQNDGRGNDDLDRRLRQIVTGNVPGIEGISPLPRSNGEANAAVADTSGTIIGTSGDWIARGQTIADLPTASSRVAAARNLALGGAVDPRWNALYSMEISDGVTTATHPIITSDGTWAGVFILQGGSISDAFGRSRGDMLRELSLAFLQSLWIFSIPALIVAIPFGIWRARSMSRRLQRLAGAAESMAAGNLRTRVRVTRMDEIGRLAEGFNHMAARIDQNDRARRAFISNVSHELRTPVSIIQGTTERMMIHPEAPISSIEESLHVIQHEGNMLVRLIDDLFTMARIEEHTLRLVREPIQIADVIGEAVSGMRDLAWSQQKVSVESLVAPELPLVSADRQRVRQIINNLLYNALRHTPEGGLVIIQAQAQAAAVEVSITDTGIGIPAEELDSVFRRYYQAEQSQRATEGSGLGLSIVQQLVEAHGGEISVDSEVGQGTTFRFTLPRATQ
ncbi:MAG TPA: HAMP domain-containing sensor histidine kinase [Thermomicrobiales bacterium]|nr:HAMP domain-containing sensor histidine kinase [Thermomicrobiales bacterium]